MSDKKAVDSSTYWTVLPSSTDWGLDVVSTDGYHSAYIKGDGCTHVWEFERPKRDRTKVTPTREVLGSHFRDEDAIYRHICELDEEITRLLALRETAIRYFESHGCDAAREEWYYGKPIAPDILTIPPREAREQSAIFTAIEQKQHAEMVASYARLSVAEEDIALVKMIAYEDGMYTITLSDGRSWQVAEAVQKDGA